MNHSNLLNSQKSYSSFSVLPSLPVSLSDLASDKQVETERVPRLVLPRPLLSVEVAAQPAMCFWAPGSNWLKWLGWLGFWWYYIFNRKGEKRQNIVSLLLFAFPLCCCHMLFFPPRAVFHTDFFLSRNQIFFSGQKSQSFDNCWPLWNELNSPMPGVHFTTQKALSSLAAISMCVGSLTGDVKDWVVRVVMVTLWGLCGETSWQSIKLHVIKVDELCFFTRLLSFIFSDFNFLKGKESKILKEAVMLTGVHLHPEILTFDAEGFFSSPISSLRQWNYLCFYIEVPLYPLRKKGQIS